MWFAGGGAFTWKATAAETGGAFILLEDRMVRGKGTPLPPASERGRGDLRARGRVAGARRGRGASRRPRWPLLRAARCRRTPSWSPPRRRACSRCRRPGRARPSTATPASRSTRRRTPPGRPTGCGCARWQSDPRASSCSGPRRSPPRSTRLPPHALARQAREGEELDDFPPRRASTLTSDWTALTEAERWSPIKRDLSAAAPTTLTRDEMRALSRTSCGVPLCATSGSWSG